MKQWSGVVGDYCLPRWKLFVEMCLLRMAEGKQINMDRFRVKVFREVENPFQVSKKRYPTEGKGDAIEVSKKLYDKWVRG